MESIGGAGAGLPPWNHPQFLNEEGLRAAQEYFFQTHATNSRMIAQGRSAQGFMKGHVRRKLNKEMGEDFKLYTGVSIGQSQDSEESKGIRGELNQLLENIYLKIAPNQPITSPVQEDVTILKHPLGGLEVLFAMSCFYTELTRRYASLASERRKVLKSVLDEELFKWVWRTFYSLVMAGPKHAPTMQETISSSGIGFIPVEKQQISSVQKIIDIGEFLLGTSLSNSHLRFPLCYYYACYLRLIQYRLLPLVSRQKLDALFTQIRTREPNQPIENVLTAVDFLMNTKGNSMQSYDDVLRDEERAVQNFVPATELEFINHHQEFVGGRFSESMSKFVPKVSKSEVLEGEGVSLIPLLFLLRTLPYAIGQKILDSMAGPFLSLIRNRLSYGGMDDVSKQLLDRIDDMIERRQERGESYTIASSGKGGTARTASRNLSPAAGGALPQKVPAGAGAEGVEPAPAASPGAEGVEPAPAAPPGAEGVEPAPAAPPEAEGAEPAPAAPQGSEGAEPAAGETEAAPGESAAPDPLTLLMTKRLILSWRARNDRLSVGSISPAEIVDLVGVDVRFLVPWVLFAIKSGQVLRIPQNQVTRETVEKILKTMLRQVGTRREAQLSVEKRLEIYQEFKGRPANQLLMGLVEKHNIGSTDPADAGALAGGIAQLHEKLGDKLEDFLNNPGQEFYRQMREGMTDGEKQALMVLNKLAATN